jgi:hypothetical protein
VIGALVPFIEAILEADSRAPRKQRHTAHRIWQRIVAERPEHKVAEVTVRQRARAKSGVGMGAACDLSAAELSTRTRSPGRLVRGLGGTERQAGAAAGVLDAEHGGSAWPAARLPRLLANF